MRLDEGEPLITDGPFVDGKEVVSGYAEIVADLDEALRLARSWPAEPDPDDRLRLIFTCCHPALPRAAQVALTLRVVCGLNTT